MKVVLLLLLNFSAFAGTISGKVVSISDGDTITILDENTKNQHKIRFEHIDTPEKKQAFGQKAKEFLAAIVFGKTVKVEVKEKDRYGRSIGTVFLDKKNVNLAMVQAGFAWHYKAYSKNKLFAQAEIEARNRKAGLWVDPKPIPPWEFRRSSKK